MEYSIDGGANYTKYNAAQPPVFDGDKTVLVRVAANDGNPAGLVKTLTFTQNAEGPATTLVGSDSIASGAAFTVQYGLNNTQQVFAQDLTLTYNSDLLEFVSAESLKEGIVIVNKVDKPGQVRLIVASTNAIAANANGDLLKLHWKAKVMAEPQAAVITLSGAKIANGEGVETEVSGSSSSVQITVVDRAALTALIMDAQNKHDAAVEGTQAGQYPVGAKAALQAAIDKARAVANDLGSTEAQVAQAMADLNAAVQSFSSSVNVSVPGDMNGDSRISIGDLAVVAAAYGKTSADPDWNQYNKADVNHDNKVDISDLAAVATMILE